MASSPPNDSRSALLTTPRRNSKHYGSDDGVIFLIEGELYRIPRSLLLKSTLFSDMFGLPAPSEGGVVEGSSDEKPICPGGVLALEIQSLLDLLNARALDGIPDFNLQQLSAILRISTIWGFDKARDYAIAQIEKASAPSLDLLELGFSCTVPKWLIPAYEELCTRNEPLKADEARRLGLERFFIVAGIREALQRGRATNVRCKGPATLAARCNQCYTHRIFQCTGGSEVPNAAGLATNAKHELNKYRTELGIEPPTSVEAPSEDTDDDDNGFGLFD